MLLGVRGNRSTYCLQYFPNYLILFFVLCYIYPIHQSTTFVPTQKLYLHLLHGLDGLRQIDGFHGDLYFAHAPEEICDQDAPWIPEEEVSTVAWSGHTLALGTNLEL